MATNRDDTFGYRRGGRGIDGNKTDDFKMPKSRCEFGEESDYGAKSVKHDLSRLIEDGQGYGDLGDSLQSQYWQPGPIKRVGDNARPKPTGYFDTHQTKAESPSGKFGKPGGKGQRSGA